MLLNGDDGLSLAAKTYRHQKIEDLRNNHVSWLVSCVLYAYSALCFLIVAVFASYGLIWPIRNKTRMVLPESRRKGTVSRHQQVHYGPQRFSNAVRRYWGSLRWFSIPATVGFAYVCYQQFWHIREREQRKLRSSEDVLQNQWQVALFKKLPTRACSRAWGKVCDIYLPIWLRRPVIGIYAWLFCCNVAEATEEELINYPSLGTFFRRQLKPEARLICKKSSIVSPVDGSVLHYGVVENDQIEQVKGITYSMKTFLGPDQPSQASLKKLESSDNNRLHHCVIYLGPGDYHSFHSPTEWTTCLRRHFPGDLFSVHPGFARMISGLFNHNERVVLLGTWKYGFFSFTAVGAYNVGSINLKFDKDLKTNCPGSYEPGSFCEIEYTIKEGQGVPLLRGEKMGAFNLGSTIVLIFEAPKDFEFNIQPGQKLKYGEPIGSCRDEKFDNNL